MTKEMHIGDELDQLKGFESTKAFIERAIQWGEDQGLGLSEIQLNLNSTEDLEELDEEDLQYSPHSLAEFVLSLSINQKLSINQNGLLAEQDRWRLVELLLSKGLEVNEYINDRQQTLIHWAAAEGYFDMMKSLVGVGADLHVKDDAGSNALHFAVTNGLSSSGEMIEWLIDQDVDSKAPNQMGHTAENLMGGFGGQAWLSRIKDRDLARSEALALAGVTAEVQASDEADAKEGHQIKRAPSL